ncbi:hypothetical protein P7C70_g3072, partial [Phenoliferia sp. Uapishka_3]
MSNPNSGGLPAPALPDIPADLPTVLDPAVEELWSSRALLIVLLLLILSFWVSYYLKIRRIRSIHETIVALFAGMAVGLLVRLAPGNVVQDMISFKSSILLNVLLPPIILNSGYQLKQENFFRNFGVILTFAFAGTFISAVVLGVIVYCYSLLGLEGLSLTIVECLLFGSTLSATDPVTILAIFNALHVDPKLYSIIFGESILNDAVAIVMFETLSQFHGEKIHVLSFFHGVGIFLLTFCISMALGVIFGLSCSLMLKHSELGRYTEIESCLVFLIAYTSYFFSNALTMSGIVSLLFCGVTLKHYAYHNMSQRTQRTSRYMFGILAQLSENFIFIYLGLSLFTQTKLVYKPMFILVTAIAVCIARYCAVFPISKVINTVYKARGQRNDELPHSYQMMMFWAGLRGAVGVALAVGMKGENAIALRTTVLVCVVLTVVVFGGTIGRMIEILGIRTGVDEEDGSSDEEGGTYPLAGGEVDIENRPNAKNKRRSIGKFNTSMDVDRLDTGTVSPADSPYRDRTIRPRSRQGTTNSGGLHSNSSSSMTNQAQSSESSEDSDPDVLPAVTDTVGPVDDVGDLTRVWRDGQWFTVLDERYLLPVFSNATASRRQATKKAFLRAKRHSLVEHGADDSFEGDVGSTAVPGSPYLNSNPTKGHAEFSGSFSDILSSLVSSSTPTTPAPYPIKRRGSNDDDDLGVGGSTIDLNLTAVGSGVRPRGSVSGGSTAGNMSPQLGVGNSVQPFGGVKRASGSFGGSPQGSTGSRSAPNSDGSAGTSGSGAGRRAPPRSPPSEQLSKSCALHGRFERSSASDSYAPARGCGMHNSSPTRDHVGIPPRVHSLQERSAISSGGQPTLVRRVVIARAAAMEPSRSCANTGVVTAWALILGMNTPLQTPILFHPFLMALTHIWAQTNPTSQFVLHLYVLFNIIQSFFVFCRVSLFGLINMPAPYFPFALLGIDLVKGGPSYALQAFTGLASAHAWYFLSTIYPAQNGGRGFGFMTPPQWLANLLVSPPSAPNASGAQGNGSTYRAGGGWAFRPRGGQRLGATPGSAGGVRTTTTTPVAQAGTAAGTAGSSAVRGGGGSYRWGAGNRLGEE